MLRDLEIQDAREIEGNKSQGSSPRKALGLMLGLGLLLFLSILLLSNLSAALSSFCLAKDLP